MKKIITGLLFLLLQTGQAVAVPVVLPVAVPTILIDDSMVKEQQSYGCPYFGTYGRALLKMAVDEGGGKEEAIAVFLVAMYKNLFWVTTNAKHRLFLAEQVFLILDTNEEPNNPHRKALMNYGEKLIDYCLASRH